MDVKLVMFRPSGQRKDFPLAGPVTVIGRGEDCDLRVPLLSVSRRHCELRVQGQTLKLKDLASSNGTYVNSSRVTEADLRAGDRLAVGPIVFTLQIDGEPQDIQPAKPKAQKAGAEDDVEIELQAEGGSSAGAASLADSDAGTDPIAALEAMASEPPKKEPPKEGR